MKKFIKPVCIILMLCFLSTGLVSCTFGGNDDAAVTYITIRINPEIELVADDDMQILATNAINEDGEIVLSELELVGMDADEAVEAFTDKAIELGYIDVESEENTLYVDVVSENEDKCEKIKESITERVNEFLENSGIKGSAIEESLENYAELVTLWGVTPGHAKIIMRILELYPEMTEKEVLALTVPERIELLREYAKNAGLTPELNEEYRETVDEIKNEYDEMFGISERMELLKAMLESATLTAEELEEIKEEYNALKARYDELRAEYMNRLSDIRDAYKERVKEKREAAKAAAAERREKNAEIVKKHFENVKSYRKKQIGFLKSVLDFLYPDEE